MAQPHKHDFTFTFLSLEELGGPAETHPGRGGHGLGVGPAV